MQTLLSEYLAPLGWPATAAAAAVLALIAAVWHNRHLARALASAQETERRNTEDFRSRLREATRDAERKRHLTTYLAHETRNLIMAVQGSLALLTADAKRAAESRVTESVSSSARALAALLDVSRDSAQASLGQFEPHLRPLDVQVLIERIADEFEPMAWHKRLTLQVEPADAPLLVTTDEVRVGQVIRNLVANALKYACEGTLLLRAFRVTEAEVRIQVVDNGRGIPLEQLSSLFAPSATAPGPGPVPKGVGLGLTLSREIAALLGGDLRARTTEARGYEFTLVLHDYRCDLSQPDQKLAA
jgi:signal transduction histidine kinase